MTTKTMCGPKCKCSMHTDTPLTDACPHCGDKRDTEKFHRYECGTIQIFPTGTKRSELCHQTEVSNLWMKRSERAEAELAAIQRLRPTRDDVKKLEAEVERLKAAIIDCLWATNTYDGNYAKACDNVAMIVTNALKSTQNSL